MKLAIIGATGYTGGPMLAEALRRGHQVRALSRQAQGIEKAERLEIVSLDVLDTAALRNALAGRDAVISAFNPGKDPSGKGANSILSVARSAGVRLLVVGGAGSLEIAPGKRLVDQPEFPPQWKEGALKTVAFLEALRNEPDLDWTFLSPAAQLVPGTRTGTFRTGSNRLLVDADGVSKISTADLAVAMLDEVENPRHRRARFTVAY
jgi:uncharacterized protein